MNGKLLRFLALFLLVGLISSPALHAQVAVGYFIVDPGADGNPNDSEIDISNLSGLFDAPTDFPITAIPGSLDGVLDLTSLSLTIGSTLEPSYFTADPTFTGSFDGLELANSVFSGATTATLTGTFEETSISVNGGAPETISSGFTAIITDATGLQDYDNQVIYATVTTSGPPPATPEPDSLLLVGTGFTALAGLRRRQSLVRLRKFFSSKAVASAAVVAIAAVLVAAPVAAHASIASDPLKLTTTLPSSGLAGLTSVGTTGTGYPTGTITPAEVTVSLATSCGGTPTLAIATAMTKVVGSTYVIHYVLPASLASGTYYVSVTGSNGTPFYSTNCSQVQVTNSTPTLAACVPTSSLAVVVGTNVNAFVPFGAWDSGSYSGIEEVPLEGTGTAQNFATSGAVNSCAANSTTGEVVCTENTTNVDVIKAGVLTTITSGSTAYAGFSGGSCENCGVGVNAANNTAVIAMGLSGAPSNTGVQVLNLSNNTFNAAFPLTSVVSEDISIDSGRNLILSPGEGNSYDLLQIGAGNSLTEYTNYQYGGGGEMDSAAEDCTTGIALASDEFVGNNIYITDLTQAVFTAGSPGTWTAPGQFVPLNGYLQYGTCGISSAPGTGHLAVTTGEFGGQSYDVLQLPSSSSAPGVAPSLVDYAYVGVMPNTPDGNGFSAGLDPHTVTAYTSPNSNKSYAVFADFALGYPSYLGVVDLACVLNLARDPGTNNVSAVQPDSSSYAADCTRYVAVP